MNNIKLIVRRPKSKNFIKQGIFAVLTGLCITGIVFLYLHSPKTDLQKIICVVLFTVFSVAFAFTFTALLNAIRNIFSRPTVILDNEQIEVFRYGKILLSDIKSVSVDESKKTLFLMLKTGESIPIKKSIVNLPLETLGYAVNIRR
ncbi:MAG: hypothetical protein DBX47_03780 [Clostridiales bacterium]|nr:MAG: hypothetical protein DBX47_03780 [Clostridiales bacterium]